MAAATKLNLAISVGLLVSDGGMRCRLLLRIVLSSPQGERDLHP